MRREQKVHVVGHEDVGMHRAVELLGEFFFGNANRTDSPVRSKTHGAIVAALNDVPGNAGDGQARSAGHGEDSVATEGLSLSEIIVVCPRLFAYFKKNSNRSGSGFRSLGRTP